MEENEEKTGWFSYYLLNGVGYVIKYIFKNALSLVQFLAKKILNYLFGFRFINQYFIINEYISGQIKIVIHYIQKKILFNANYKLFTFCLILYFLILISAIMNSILVFSSPNSVYIFIFLNIILLLSFIFYSGSKDFFDILLIDDNLNFFVVFFTVIFISICIPKNIILSIPLSIILILTNIFFLVNFKFTGIQKKENI